MGQRLLKLLQERRDEFLLLRLIFIVILIASQKVRGAKVETELTGFAGLFSPAFFQSCFNPVNPANPVQFGTAH
jgi:hypothetical protein